MATEATCRPSTLARMVGPANDSDSECHFRSANLTWPDASTVLLAGLTCRSPAMVSVAVPPLRSLSLNLPSVLTLKVYPL